MTGYRCGFVAGDADADRRAARVPADVGTAPQEFVQRASVAAWGDEEHVERSRALLRAQADALLPVLERKGLASPRARATMYLWVEVPRARRRRRSPSGCSSTAIVVAPGSFFGPSGEGYVRFALVPTDARSAERAAALLEEVL